MKNAEEIASAAGYSGKNAVLPEAFVTMFGKMFGQNILDGYLSAEDALPVVRMNPSKPYGRNVLSCMKGQVPWCGNAFTLALRPSFTHDPAFQSGCYYVQDSSSMFMAPFPEYFNNAADTVFKVLDLCAAPGGKTTLLSDLCRTASDRYVIVANEVMRTRATVLADNVARWGDSSIIVTSSDPSDFSTLESVFDMVLADVPCSGEGMFRKDMEAIENWSPDNVRLCSSRQRRIVADVWPALKPGGILIYSTCTFNYEENDGNVGWICSELGAEVEDVHFPSGNGVLRSACGGYHFIPGMVEGEGQYFAILRKKGEDCGTAAAGTGRKNRNNTVKCMPALNGPYLYVAAGDMVKAMFPHVKDFADMISPRLKIIASGTAVYSVKGKDFAPHPDLAFSCDLNGNLYETADIGLEDAVKFMSRENFALGSVGKGYILLKYGEIPLGFVKNIGNRFNTLWPMSRRIRTRMP